MNRIVVATGNRGKLGELSALLAPLGLEILGQSALGVPGAEETAPTFVENALIKARQAARHTGLAAIADDSGLEVDTLGGAPGVRSARYAGRGATDRDNVRRLLSALAGVEPARRTARFQCVVVRLRYAADPTPLICQGTWEGLVTERPRGEGGFGYDPVFLVPALGRTAAELTAEEKNRLSHRGQALARLVAALAASGD